MKKTKNTRILWLAAFLAMNWTYHSTAGEVDFSEHFALAENREEALKQLIPGTEDYYYFHALNHQHKGEFAKVDELLKTWQKRNGETEHVFEIKHRQALLQYDANPKATLDYLRRALDLRFNHQQEIPDRKPDLPNALNQDSISRAALLKRALQSDNGLGDLQIPALDWLLRSDQKLSPLQLRQALERIERPDFPNLVDLILLDLKTKEARGFGDYKIHRALLPEQLQQLAAAQPELMRNVNFINTWLTKLRPDADTNWRRDTDVRSAYLQRLWDFVSKLDPAFNSLKANVLFKILDQNRELGKYPKDLFMTYIQLPRRGGFANPKAFANTRDADFYDLHANYMEFTALRPINSDDSLIRDYLLHLFVNANSYDDITPFLSEGWVKPIFAEAKITNSIGDQEKWTSMISPTDYQALKDRVDIDFAPENPKQLAPGDEVKLVVDVKNVRKLIAKIYHINAFNYYLENGIEVSTDLNLDGLVANSETSYDFDETALQRVRRTFEFPELKGKRGIWVIELIGNGRSSRALVRKGGLQYLSRNTLAGTDFTVLDENNEKVENAAVWIGSRKYMADEQGHIIVPFSTNPQNVPVVLTDGDFASLDTFQHPAENYQFEAGFHVDRETLLPGKTTSITIRPTLTINGSPTSVALLEDVRLTIVSTDTDGVQSSNEIPNISLKNDREFTHDFRVPERLQNLEFRISATIENISSGKDVALADAQSFSLNGINTTQQIESIQLVPSSDGFTVEVLGLTGEPRADRAATIELHHRDFSNTVNVSLKTDANGRITLGALQDIVSLTVTLQNGVSQLFNIPDDKHSWRAALHGTENSELLVPLMGGEMLSPENFALFEVREGTFVSDKFSALSIDKGYLKVRNLPPGDFELFLKQDQRKTNIKITAGKESGDYILSKNRHLQTANTKPLQIESITTKGDDIIIRLSNANEKFARVHFAAVRYLPEYPLFNNLGGFPAVQPMTIQRGYTDTVYLSGRDIGDEYRYILGRRNATVYPGNMLTRAGLLLNPWELRSTDTNIDTATDGEKWDKSKAEEQSKRMAAPDAMSRAKQKRPQGPAVNHPSLDFMKFAAPILLNLVPDENGEITIPRAALGDRHYLQVLAVDPHNSAFRQLALEEKTIAKRDLRLLDGLAPDKHLIESDQATILSKGESKTINDVRSAKIESYDSLQAAYRLLSTLSSNETLAEFRFLLDWPTMKPEQKREKHSKYACHELNFFLSRRDPEFFKTVIAPYLANKKDKTFMDEYLIGSDLTAYLEAWRYGTLNAVEKILLARRIGGEESKSIARYMQDLADMLPPDVERDSFLFGSALGGLALLGDMDADGLQSATSLSRFSRRLSENETLMEEAVPQRAALQILESKSRGAMPAASAEGADDPFAAPAAAGLGFMKKQRQLGRGFFRKMEATKEWAENNYYHVHIEEQISSLVDVNDFWRDYAAWNGEGVFLSAKFTQATQNFTELMFALSVLDLPLAAAEHEVEQGENSIKITAASPAIIFHREMSEAPISDDKTPILISQNFYRVGDRYTNVGNERIDKFVTEEFLSGVVYGCEVVVTNPTSSVQKLDVLVQVPHFSIPVQNVRFTQGQHQRLEPYATGKFDFYFYFPTAADQNYAHFPVHTAKSGAIIAWADPFSFKVVDKLSKVDTASWDYVSQMGSSEEVVAFLEQNNLNRLNLERIAWRMRDAAFFQKAIALLSGRHHYDGTLYSYALHHNDLAAMQQYLKHTALALPGGIVSTPLTIDPVETHEYQHLEYSPLVNARAHQLGAGRKILNDVFWQQYHEFIALLVHKPQLSNDDNLTVAYYLLLQDRIEEGLAFFAKVDAEKLATRLQYDYFQCYTAFYKEQPDTALKIAEKYADYPVDRWQKLFAQVISQTKEVSGDKAQSLDPEDREQRQDVLADTEPSFEFKVENREIVIDYRHLEEVRVNYYRMDLEFLFSSNPFVSSDSGRFSLVRPNASDVVKLPGGGKTKHAFALPKDFHTSNVLVEIVGPGSKKSAAYYANTLNVQVAENYGRLSVRDAETDKPLAKTYVKVYAQFADGTNRFFKDGYTDLRGKFDYISLNTDELSQTQKLAILIMSDQHGAIVKEVAPPKQ
jgi:hypothetical protein